MSVRPVCSPCSAPPEPPLSAQHHEVTKKGTIRTRASRNDRLCTLIDSEMILVQPHLPAEGMEIEDFLRNANIWHQVTMEPLLDPRSRAGTVTGRLPRWRASATLDRGRSRNANEGPLFGH